MAGLNLSALLSSIGGALGAGTQGASAAAPAAASAAGGAVPDLAGLLQGVTGGLPRAPEQSGWEGVGQNLMGRGGGDAYARGADAGLGLIKKQLEAKQAQNKALARESFLKNYTAAHPDAKPADIDLLNNIIQGEIGSEFSSATTGMQNQVETTMMQDAAAPGVPLERQNQLNAARTGKLVDLTKIDSGNVFNPNVAPNDPTQSITRAPTAISDDERQSIVAGSQVQKNVAAAARSERVPRDATGKPAKDAVGDYAAKAKVKAIFDEYRPQLARARNNIAESERLVAERDSKVSQVTESHMAAHRPVNQNLLGEANAAANAWADDKRANGVTPTAGEIESRKREYRETGVILDVTPGIVIDGTRPPQVIDQDGKPVGGGRAATAGKPRLNRDVYKAAFTARQQGKSKAGIVAKMRDNGYTAEADQFEKLVP